MRKIYLTLILIFAISFAAEAQRAKSVILIYLDGGPAQTDTFDPKPKAGRNYHGNYKNVCQTNVEGIEIGEKLPSERQLCDMMQVSRAVVNSGLAELEKNGFLVF